jgi:SAM-dependent methyltransferase
VAVDISPLMLERLRAKSLETQLTNVELVEAGFLSYDHVGAPADFVYSRWALHHLPDFWKALALTRMREILKPGGVFRLTDIAYSFEPSEAANRIEAWCATLSDVAQNSGDWVDIEEHVRDEHSTFTWLLEPMIERAGFRIEQADHSRDGFYATTSPRRSDLDAGPRRRSTCDNATNARVRTPR